MAVALREFFFPIEKVPTPPKPSPYPEPRKPFGVPPPKTEAEAAAAAVKIVFGPLNWIDDQYAKDRRAKPWKQVSFRGRLGQDPSGQDYTLDLRGGWREFILHPIKTTKSAVKKLIIRKAYDAMQTSALRKYHDLWQTGKISQQDYTKFVGRVNKALEWAGPRNWKKIQTPQGVRKISTSLTKGSGKLWEWMEFVDNPIGYTMRKVVWKKGVKPAISKVTSPITKPIRKFVDEKIKAPIKKKVIDPIKEAVKKAIRKVWKEIKKRVKSTVKKVISKKVIQTVSKVAKKAAQTVAKKVGQVASKFAATTLKQALVVAGKAAVAAAGHVVTFVGSAVSSLATAATSAVSAPVIAIIAVAVILLLIVLALITTIGTHSAFLPPGLGSPLPGERFVQLRKLIYHETKAGVGVNPLKILRGARPDVNFEIVYRNISGGRLDDVLLVDNFDEDALTVDPASTQGLVESAGVDERLVWGIGDLEPDQAGTVFYSTTLKSTASDQVIFNNVTLTATDEDGKAVNVTAQGVVIVGEPEGQPPSGWPTVPGCISQGFNVTTDPNASHYGVDAIDIAGVTNQAILATHDGVAYVGETARAGKYVRVTSAVSGFSTFYCHLETRAVATGDIIVPGQRIGGMGNTGRSTATHIHYDVKKDDILVTSQYIPDNSFNGCVDTVRIGGNCNCCFNGRDETCSPYR